LIEDWDCVLFTAIRASTGDDSEDLSGSVHLLVGNKVGDCVCCSRKSETSDGKSVLRSVTQSENQVLQNLGGKGNLIRTTWNRVATNSSCIITSSVACARRRDEIVGSLIAVHRKVQSLIQESFSASGNGKSELELELGNDSIGRNGKVVVSQVTQFELLLDVESASAIVVGSETHSRHSSDSSRRTPTKLD